LEDNPDKPELKIEDCRLNICGGRFAPSFFKMERVPEIFNIQSFEDNENIPIQFFCHKMHKKNL